MSKTLKSFQKDRLSDIGEFHKKASSPEASAFKKRTCIVAGPTGSGKTVIISAAIKKFFENAFVLVLSPGAGNLDDQTRDVLRSELMPYGFDVNDLRLTDLKHRPRAKCVRTVNWQSVASFEKATGNYANVLTRFGGERENLFTFLAKNGAPVIIVIDEAHHGKGSSAKSIPLFLSSVTEALGYTPMVFEFSATPVIPKGMEAVLSSRAEDGDRLTIVQSGDELYGYTNTTYDEAVDAQLLRRRTLLNDGVKEVVAKWTDEEAQTKASRRFIVERALIKQRELRDLYAKRGVSVWPLVGIQLPNSIEGNEVQKDIIDYLAHLPQHIEGETAITEGVGLVKYLQNDKSASLDGIESLDSQVRVLLYKTAVATGWNCPRAQILVGFRKLNSAQFSIQNRGRFLRTLEGKHYEAGGASPLDWAYIYADVATMGGVTGDPNDSDREDIRLMADAQRRGEWDAFGLPIGGLERTGQDTVDPAVIKARLEHFYPVFASKFDEDYADLTVPESATIAIGAAENAGDDITVTDHAKVRSEVDDATLQKQIEGYITEDFYAGGVHFPARNYERNARVAEHTMKHVMSILKTKDALVQAQLDQRYDAFETFIIPKVMATPRLTTAADGTQTMVYDFNAPGAVGLRDWVHAVFTSDDAPEPKTRVMRGEVVTIDAKKPVEPTPVAEGASRDHWSVKFTGSHVALPAILGTIVKGGQNYITGPRAAASLYQTPDGKALPVGGALKDTEKAFEGYLLGLKSLGAVKDIWFAKNQTTSDSFQLPVEWEVDGVKRVTRFFPDYFGVITFDDGTEEGLKKPFVFEVKSKAPEGQDGKKVGVTKAKSEYLARYAGKTGAIAAVVYPTDAGMTRWSVFRAAESGRVPVSDYVTASAGTPVPQLPHYPFGVKAYDKAPADLSWMLEPIQL